MKVGIVCTARPSWSKLLPVVRALLAREQDIVLYMAGGAVLVKYGAVIEQARTLFPSATIREVFSVLEGATLVTSAKETAGLLHSLADLFALDHPEVVVVNHDRHEVVAVAQAASYLHIPVVHIGGGERSGSIDDRCRDAITQLADYHCVATERAKCRVYALTGAWDRIVNTGCPSIDVAKEAQASAPVSFEELGGSGPRMDLAYPFLVVLQHSVTDEADQAGEQMQATLEAVTQVRLPRVVFWPGEDAGQEAMAKVIRVWKDQRPELAIHTVRNLPPARFLRLLTQSACIVGNSSASVREAAYLGTPAVVIGSRQLGREHADNAVCVPHDYEKIRDAILKQIDHGPYPTNTLYGNGMAGERIADVVCRMLSRSHSRLRVIRSATRARRR